MPKKTKRRYTWLSNWTTLQGRRWLFWTLYERFVRTLPYPNWRSLFLKLGGAQIGDRCFVHDVIFLNTYVNGFKNLELGDSVTIQSQCVIDLAEKVVIQKEATISPQVTIFTHEDCGLKLGKPLAEFFPPKKAPVRIGRGAWLGGRSLVLCGVNIGECAVVGAGSLVKNDVDDWTLVKGNPAIKVRSIKEQKA